MVRVLAALLFLSVFFGGTTQHARAHDEHVPLDVLFSWLAKVEGLISDFREEKRLSLVAMPLVSEGTLYYQKRPRQLARHTLKPTKSSVLLTGNVVQFGDAKRTETISLDAQPAVRVLVDTFASVLAGDLAALSKVAKVSHEAPPKSPWRIHVVPRDAKLLRIVRSMSFEGKEAELAKMDMVDGHGDVTTTTFKNTRFGKLSPAQAKSAFRIGG